MKGGVWVCIRRIVARMSYSSYPIHWFGQTIRWISKVSETDPIKRMLNEVVVLDTATSIVYIGRLVEITENTFVLQEADMHDSREGHANKEVYLSEAFENGVTPNRKTVVVMRCTIISVSRLADIVST